MRVSEYRAQDLDDLYSTREKYIYIHMHKNVYVLNFMCK